MEAKCIIFLNQKGGVAKTTSTYNIAAAKAKEGKTVLLVEQNAFAALKIADYAYVLEVGEITLQGPGEKLLSDPRVVSAYLGG